MSQLIVLENIPVVPRTIDDWTDAIAKNWFSSVEAIFRTAKLVLEADRILGPEENKKLIRKLEDRGIGGATISKLRKIAHSQNFQEDHMKCLPASYNYLYSLASLDDDQYGKVYTKLSQGKDYSEATKILRKKKISKNKRLRQLFSFSAEPDKLGKELLVEIQKFVDAYNRRSIIQIRRTPLYNKLFSDEK